MLILGINAFHADAAAVVVDGTNGNLVAAIAEERLNRTKHFGGFPQLAIRQCLRIAGARPQDIGHVAIARDAKANLIAKLGFAVRNLPRMPQMAHQRLHRRAQIAGVRQLLERALGVPRERLSARVHHVEHHLAHLASSFLVSPFERAALMSIDGFGDFASTMRGVGEGTEIGVRDRTLFPHSMGILYTALCQIIGYDRYGDEGKVMGLAPYGEDSYRDVFDEIVRLEDQGRFKLNLDYFVHHTQGVDYSFDRHGRPLVAPLYTECLARRLGGVRQRHHALTQRDLDIARSLQACLERVYCHILNDLYQRSNCKNLCLSGGVALNAVANGQILARTPFQQVFVQPAAGDDGTALGAAYWIYHHVLRRPRSFEMQHAYTGTQFDDSEVAAALRSAGVGAKKLDHHALLQRTAQSIAQGKVVGWFQGAMEWGPRALGNRSILAHPGHPKMKDILNARVKHREWFRPFAPSILHERLGDYFECSHASPFMLMVSTTRPEVRQKISAVNHVDNTARLQSVTGDCNPRFHALIRAFEQITGIPLILNTSFNENEPIVCSPAEAIDCFQRTRIDVLAIGDYFCEANNLRQNNTYQAHSPHDVKQLAAA